MCRDGKDSAIVWRNAAVGFWGGAAFVALYVGRLAWLEYKTGESTTARTERMKFARDEPISEQIHWAVLHD